MVPTFMIDVAIFTFHQFFGVVLFHRKDRWSFNLALLAKKEHQAVSDLRGGSVSLPDIYSRRANK